MSKRFTANPKNYRRAGERQKDRGKMNKGSYNMRRANYYIQDWRLSTVSKPFINAQNRDIKKAKNDMGR